MDGLPAAVAIAAGGSFSLALDTQGHVFFWGTIPMGDGAPSSSLTALTPTLIEGLPAITAIATGWSHALVLDSEGRVWAWGANGQGALGDGTTDDRATPVRLPLPTPLPGGEGVRAIAAGAGLSAALTAGGEIWTWGDGRLGQLGDGGFSSCATPAPVPALAGVTAVACGGAHVLAITGGGVWGWGYNRYAAVGDGGCLSPPESPSGNAAPEGPPWESRAEPTPVPDLNGALQIEAGTHHSVVLLGTGAVVGWGSGRFGQLGAVSPVGPELDARVVTVPSVITSEPQG